LFPEEWQPEATIRLEQASHNFTFGPRPKRQGFLCTVGCFILSFLMMETIFKG